MCPVFQFTVSRNAGYHYEGHKYVEPLGKRTGGLPGHLFDRLAETCIELRVVDLDDVYPSDFDFSASTIVAIRHGGGTKTVRSENGYGPTRLWAFAKLIEAVMRDVIARDGSNQRPANKK
jgi:hypothetical protein